jgi:WXG100 family type VII secretion target
MAQIQTTTPGMQQSSSVMETTRGNINSDRSQVSSALSTLASTWRGDASSAFAKACQPWFDDVDRIMQKLQEMADLLDGNRQLITRTEDDATSTANTMGGNIGLAL